MIKESLLLFGGLATILFSGCELKRVQINSDTFYGTVISESRNDKEYVVTINEHNLDKSYYGGKILNVIFKKEDFDLEKLDEKIHIGIRLEVYGTEASRKVRDNDFIAHNILQIEGSKYFGR